MKNLLLPFIIISLFPSSLFASLDGAYEDYAIAKRYMKNWDPAKAIFYLTRARNDFVNKPDLGAADKKALIEISKHLYWSIKNKPYNMEKYVGPPRGTKLDLPDENKFKSEEETEEVVEEPKEVAVKVVEEEAPEEEKEPEEVAEVEVVENKKEDYSDKSPAFRQAMKFIEENPDDLDTQYLLLGQTLEEENDLSTLQRVLDLMGDIREQIKVSNTNLHDYWMEEITGLKDALQRKDYAYSIELIKKSLKSRAYTKGKDKARKAFKSIASHAIVMKKCKDALIDYNFKSSLLADGIFKGFEGNLIDADSKTLTIVSRGKSGTTQGLDWSSFSEDCLARCAGQVFTDDNKDQLLLKALAYKVTNQIDLAYKTYWRLMKLDPSDTKISDHLQDCEQRYLAKHAEPIEKLIQDVHFSLQEANRKQAAKAFIKIHRKLNHPLLAVYHHQVRIIRRKANFKFTQR